jgi:hypothetical protein
MVCLYDRGSRTSHRGTAVPTSSSSCDAASFSVLSSLPRPVAAEGARTGTHGRRWVLVAAATAAAARADVLPVPPRVPLPEVLPTAALVARPEVLPVAVMVPLPDTVPSNHNTSTTQACQQLECWPQQSQSLQLCTAFLLFLQCALYLHAFQGTSKLSAVPLQGPCMHLVATRILLAFTASCIVTMSTREPAAVHLRAVAGAHLWH